MIKIKLLHSFFSMAESIVSFLTQSISFILTYQAFKGVLFRQFACSVSSRCGNQVNLSYWNPNVIFLLCVSGKDLNRTRMCMLYLTEHTLDGHLSVVDLAISEQGMTQGLPCTRERSSV